MVYFFMHEIFEMATPLLSACLFFTAAGNTHIIVFCLFRGLSTKITDLHTANRECVQKDFKFIYAHKITPMQ